MSVHFYISRMQAPRGTRGRWTSLQHSRVVAFLEDNADMQLTDGLLKEKWKKTENKFVSGGPLNRVAVTILDADDEVHAVVKADPAIFAIDELPLNQTINATRANRINLALNREGLNPIVSSGMRYADVILDIISQIKPSWKIPQYIKDASTRTFETLELIK